MAPRSKEMRKEGTVQRLLDNELIYPGGKLTARGIEEAARLERMGIAARRIDEKPLAPPPRPPVPEVLTPPPAVDDEDEFIAAYEPAVPAPPKPVPRPVAGCPAGRGGCDARPDAGCQETCRADHAGRGVHAPGIASIRRGRAKGLRRGSDRFEPGGPPHAAVIRGRAVQNPADQHPLPCGRATAALDPDHQHGTRRGENVHRRPIWPSASP